MFLHICKSYTHAHTYTCRHTHTTHVHSHTYTCTHTHICTHTCIYTTCSYNPQKVTFWKPNSWIHMLMIFRNGDFGRYLGLGRVVRIGPHDCTGALWEEEGGLSEYSCSSGQAMPSVVARIRHEALIQGWAAAVHPPGLLSLQNHEQNKLLFFISYPGCNIQE